MFTGLIEAVGTVVGVRDRDDLRALEIDAGPEFLDGVGLGDSIAVDGACFSVVGIDERRFGVEVIRSSLERTVAGTYRVGHRVNLERALALGGRLEGHIVQGHVDGIGHLRRVRDQGETRFMEVRVPPEIHQGTILHGSIAFNGVSLTVNRLEEPDLVEVALIPHTWEHTNFESLRPGDALNVEGDLIGKYVGRLLRVDPRVRRGSRGVRSDRLRDLEPEQD